MIVALIGTPSPLTYIATNFLRAIIQVTCGEHHMIGVNRVADLREAWPKTGETKPPMLVASDMPHEDLLNLLNQSKIPLVLCLENFDEICNYMITCRKIDGLSAIRIATQSLSNLEGLAAQPPRPLLKMAPSAISLTDMIQTVLKFCGALPDRDAAARVAAFLGFADRGELLFSEFLVQSRKSLLPDLEGDLHLSQDDFEALGEISKGYNKIVEGQYLEQTFWRSFCFLQADAPGMPLGDFISLEGKARFLIYGPYFHLPAGVWSVEIVIEVEDSLSENRIGFDVTSGNVLCACTTVLPTQGTLACDMVFRNPDANMPIEIRIQTLTGAIEGRLRLQGAWMRRKQDTEENLMAN